jgi:hypothetical protein
MRKRVEGSRKANDKMEKKRMWKLTWKKGKIVMRVSGVVKDRRAFRIGLVQSKA